MTAAASFVTGNGMIKQEAVNTVPSYESFQMVVGLALTDQQFLGTFMNDRPRALANLPLSEEEAGVLLNINGRSFADVSRKLDSYIERHTRPATRRIAVPVGAEDW